MKIELLFPEVANLFGDSGNLKYLEKLFPKAEYIRSNLDSIPRFITHDDVDLIVLLAMSEKTQEKLIEKFKPYKYEIEAAIEAGKHFLFLGNSLEILGEYIETDEGEKIAGLKIFPIYAKRQMMKRISSAFQGDKDGIKIYGIKAQFTQIYFIDSESEEKYSGFCSVEKGIGLNKDSDKEGLHYKNFIATNVIGPLLILNPKFTKIWAENLGRDPELELPYSEIIYKAYERREAYYENL